MQLSKMVGILVSWAIGRGNGIEGNNSSEPSSSVLVFFLSSQLEGRGRADSMKPVRVARSNRSKTWVSICASTAEAKAKHAYSRRCP